MSRKQWENNRKLTGVSTQQTAFSQVFKPWTSVQITPTLNEAKSQFQIHLEKQSPQNRMEPPEPPNESDCCNSGCNPCILDVYEEQLKKFKLQSETIGTTYASNCINETSYSVFKLRSVQKHTPEAFLYTFEYARPYRGASQGDVLRYNPGQHFLLKAQDLAREFTRAYTPIFSKGLSFTILVKLYEDGRMSKYLKRQEIGAETLWRGPYGSFEVRPFKYMLFIAQGTGIAPIYALIASIVDDDTKEIFVKLFFCCREIFLREELYALQSHWNFKYEAFSSIISNSKYNEVVHKRRLEKNDLLEYLQNKSDVQIVICGSSDFSAAVSEYVKDSGCDLHIF